MHYYLLYYVFTKFKHNSIILHYFNCPTVLNCDTILL
jgi:hypothetical protein